MSASIDFRRRTRNTFRQSPSPPPQQETKQLSKRSRRRQKAFLEPKPPPPPDPMLGRQLTKLDGSLTELKPKRWPVRRSDAVRAVSIWIDAALARGHISRDGDADDEVDLRLICQVAELSPQQTEVFCAVAEGFTHRHIATHMGIAPSTVQEHLTRARLKMAGIWPIRLDSLRRVV
jgi:DNA-directed RNA polymerase specialized sigma24 family protein